MSSGSSGRSWAEPEPCFWSIDCLRRRILVGVFWQSFEELAFAESQEGGNMSGDLSRGSGFGRKSALAFTLNSFVNG